MSEVADGLIAIGLFWRRAARQRRRSGFPREGQRRWAWAASSGPGRLSDIGAEPSRGPRLPCGKTPGQAAGKSWGSRERGLETHLRLGGERFGPAPRLSPSAHSPGRVPTAMAATAAKAWHPKWRRRNQSTDTAGGGILRPALAGLSPSGRGGYSLRLFSCRAPG